MTNVAEEIESLRERQAELEQEDHALARKLYEMGSAVAVGAEVARERDALVHRIHVLNGERTAVSRAIWESKEHRKRERRQEVLHSDAYHAAVMNGLGALEGLLSPWASRFALSVGDPSLPALPPLVGLLCWQMREDAERLIREGVLRLSDIPEGLRPFLDGELKR